MRSPPSLKCRPQRHFGAAAPHYRELRIIRKSPHHLHHHPTSGRSCVDCLSQAAESSPGFPEPFHDRDTRKNPRDPVLRLQV